MTEITHADRIHSQENTVFTRGIEIVVVVPFEVWTSVSSLQKKSMLELKCKAMPCQRTRKLVKQISKIYLERHTVH